MEDPCVKVENLVNQEWSSYNVAAEGLEQFENMLIGDKGNPPEGVCIYVELICHSYNDEMSKAAISVISLISLRSNIVAFLVAFYTASTIEENTQGAIDGISAAFTMWESFTDGDKKGIVTQLGGEAIVHCNDVYTVISSVVNFFYVSYDTYIENINLTLFTNTHAHLYERKLDREGKLISGIHNHIYAKDDYIANGSGRGLKWKEDPGVYVRNLMHKGDNNSNDEQKVKSRDEIKGKAPISKPEK